MKGRLVITALLVATVLGITLWRRDNENERYSAHLERRIAQLEGQQRESTLSGAQAWAAYVFCEMKDWPGIDARHEDELRKLVFYHPAGAIARMRFLCDEVVSEGILQKNGDPLNTDLRADWYCNNTGTTVLFSKEIQRAFPGVIWVLPSKTEVLSTVRKEFPHVIEIKLSELEEI